MTKALIITQIDSQMALACEAINAGQYLAAKAAYLECAELTEMLNLDDKADQVTASKQITLDIDTQKS